MGGGFYNCARGSYSVVSGGGGDLPIDSNSATGDYSTISGGKRNKSTGFAAAIGGGVGNTAGFVSTVGGGEGNTASGGDATIAGGQNNTASGNYATVGGGLGNNTSNSYGTVSGGLLNTASGFYSVVPGGSSNVAAGEFSFAAGGQAKANHAGAFVWADNSSADFASSGVNQFLIRASGGVGIDTANPGSHKLFVKSSGSGTDGSTVHIVNQSSTGIGMTVQNTSSDVTTLVSQIGAGDVFRCDSWTGGWHSVFTIKNNGDAQVYRWVGIGNVAPSATLDVNGMARIRNLPAFSGTTVITDGLGNLGKAVSSRRYKENIHPLTIDTEDVLKLQPVRFQYKETHVEDIGLIAEDVDEVIKDLVIYDSEGKPEAVKYDKIAIYLLEVIKQQQKEIEYLKSVVKPLEPVK